MTDTGTTAAARAGGGYSWNRAPGGNAGGHGPQLENAGPADGVAAATAPAAPPSPPPASAPPAAAGSAPQPEAHHGTHHTSGPGDRRAGPRQPSLRELDSRFADALHQIDAALAELDASRRTLVGAIEAATAPPDPSSHEKAIRRLGSAMGRAHQTVTRKSEIVADRRGREVRGLLDLALASGALPQQRIDTALALRRKGAPVDDILSALAGQWAVAHPGIAGTAPDGASLGSSGTSGAPDQRT